jgi:DNA polymerase-4
MQRASTILHLDMDAFFAAVEQRDNPALRGLPIVVGGSGPRGVVATASYEARKFGVRSAMPMFEARRKCPQATIVPPRMSAYVAVSEQLMSILGRFSPLVEALSLDEAFVDLTGTERINGPAAEVADRIRRLVGEELALTASVGLASTRFVAKVASDRNKPNGTTIVPAGSEVEFLRPLPIECLWGVGAKTAPILHAAGLRRIGDLHQFPIADLRRLVGDRAEHLYDLARGIDPRPVGTTQTRQSLGAERTWDRDLCGRDAVRASLLVLADDVARGLRQNALRAGGVRLKLTYAGFERVTRELRLPSPVADAASILAAIDVLLDRVDTERPVRLAGLTAIALVADTGPNVSLFDDVSATVRRERLERTADAVGSKFGSQALKRGSELTQAPKRTRWG